MVSVLFPRNLSVIREAGVRSKVLHSLVEKFLVWLVCLNACLMNILFLFFGLIFLFLLFDCKIGTSKKAENGACPGVEPGTSRTLSENHATRPTGHS